MSFKRVALTVIGYGVVAIMDYHAGDDLRGYFVY